ncbi:hypothetical protein HLI03_28210 [Rhizobium laguerreae]|uniref:hypothetical protein n=1 Tax=Rhizobium laguerreae TaxID=1076926 RepID=UPI001478109B|nr:hypothetical protein [Rhizobium laguerreae]NNH45487.1 hypothetical protein [Rhizobium laguerreae]
MPKLGDPACATIMYLFHGSGEDFPGLDPLGNERLNVRLSVGNLGKSARSNVCTLRKQLRIDALKYLDCLISGSLSNLRQAVAPIFEKLLSGGKETSIRAMFGSEHIPPALSTKRAGGPVGGKAEH